AARVVLLGGVIILAHLQFVNARDRHVQPRLGIVARRGVAQPRGGETAEYIFVACHQRLIELVRSLVDGLGRIIKRRRRILRGGKRPGQRRRFYLVERNGNFRFRFGIFQCIERGLHFVIKFGGRGFGQLIFCQRRDGGRIRILQSRSLERRHLARGREQIQRVVRDGG